jgi:aryl-alcohol dehydrogenase-like predicted oxidoreductase
MVWAVGLDGSLFGWASGALETANTLDRFAEMGGNLVSTSDHFAGGRSEVMIGSWLRTIPDRSAMVIATRVGRHPDYPGLSARNVMRATEASLERLGTDYIDFLSVDGDDPSVPLDETLEGLDRLQRDGKVLHVSVAGFSAARIRAMHQRGEEAAYPRVSLVLPEYSLLQRHAYEKELWPVARELHLGVFARRPLADGFLTNVFQDGGANLHSPVWASALTYVGRRGTRVIEALRAVAREHGIGLSRAALAWALSKPGVTATLVPARNADDLLEAFYAREVILTRHQVALLDRASEMPAVPV